MQGRDSGDATQIIQNDPEDKLEQPETNVLRYERYDSFQSRSFRVPKTADLSTVSAKYEDGVLTVDIKKRHDVLENRRTVDIA
jgi:HSP20 family molecular chaperone IbpA